VPGCQNLFICAHSVNTMVIAMKARNNTEILAAANTKLQPAANDMDLGGEIPVDHSVSALTRVKAGKDRYEVEFGVDVWLTDILTTEEGFQMTVLSLGYRYSF